MSLAGQNSRLQGWAITVSALGLLLVLVVAVVRVELTISGKIAAAILELVLHSGMALFVVGIVGVLLDTPHWQAYFQERLCQIVIGKDFLANLSKEELKKLQADSLRAYFGLEGMKREGSFLEFFEQRIKQHIGNPYRENASLVTQMELAPNPKELLVTDSIGFTCRKVGDHILERVGWQADLQDVISVDDYSIEVVPPEGPDAAVEKVHHVKGDPALTGVSSGVGFSYSLARFQDLDGTKVNVMVRYRVSVDSYFSWQMTHITRGVRLTVKYPREFGLRVDPFGFDAQELRQVPGEGLYIAEYDSWVLPLDGFAFEVIPAESAR